MPDRPPFAPGARQDSSPRVEVASLAGLRRALEDPGYAAVCFVGPSGPARADLLHALAEAVRGRSQLVYLRGSGLPPGGFWMRVAEALELASGYDARRRVLRVAGDLSHTGQALLLALDDAHLLPADTLYALLATARSQPGLLVVLAHGAGDRLAGPLPEDVALVLGAEAPGPLGLPPAGAGAPAAPTLVEAPAVAGALVRAEEAARSDASPARDAAAVPAQPSPVSVAPTALAKHGDLAAAEVAAPPWELPPGPPVRSRRRAARERRRERRRRLAWGVSGLAAGILAAAAIDVERWRPMAVRVLERVAAVGPPGAPDPERPPSAPVARNAPPDDAASAPTGEAAVATADAPVVIPAPATPDVGAPPPGADEATASARREDAATGPRDDGGAAPLPDASAPAQPASPTRVAPPVAAAPRPEAPTGSEPPPTAVQPTPPAALPLGAPSPTIPGAVAPPLETPPPAAPGASAAPAPAAPPTAPRRRGPPALGSLAVASDEPARIAIDGRSFGPTPLTGIRLTRGEHRILAYFPDGSVAQKTIFLDEQDVAVEFRVR